MTKGKHFHKQWLGVLKSLIEQKELWGWPSTKSMVSQGPCTCKIQRTGPGLLSLFLESPHSYDEQQSPVFLQLSVWPTVLQGGMSYCSNGPHYSSHLMSKIGMLTRVGLRFQLWNDWKLCVPLELRSSAVLKGPLFTLVDCCPDSLLFPAVISSFF